MTRRTEKVVLSLILAFCVANAFAQSDVQLTFEQQKKFDAEKVTITPLMTVVVNTRTGVGSGTAVSPESKMWKVVRGYELIDEPTFLELAGYPEEAKASRSHLRKKRLFGWGGIGIGVAGSAVGLLSLMNWINSSPISVQDPWFYGVVGGYGAGLCGMVVGLALGGGPDKITPVGKAELIAEEFNRALARSIRKESAE
ncbi:MAG: hypothetical protein NT005_03355 [Spirochaetes bacterium]|nr:hypothetical protein [Spirochaetota bacterium]